MKNIFSFVTPPILKSPNEQSGTGFVFDVAQQKNSALLTNLFHIFLLHWCDFTPIARFLLGLQRACSLPALCTGCLEFNNGLKW